MSPSFIAKQVSELYISLGLICDAPATDVEGRSKL